MRLLLVLIVSSFAAGAFAAPSDLIQFKQDTQVPQELQAKVIEKISESCPQISQAVEVETSIKIVQVDQGVQDSYYSMDLQARSLKVQNPRVFQLKVQGVEWAVSHPDIEKFEILDISSEYSQACL